MLTGKYWIVPGMSAINLSNDEHDQVAMAIMLALPRPTAPRHWLIKGVPHEELDAALARNADLKAIRYLENKNHDPRLYAIREYGWVRTYKNKFNLWRFDDATAEMVRQSDYWAMQPQLNDHDMIDVEEFDGTDRFEISVKRLLDGGRPSVLKNLAMSRITPEEAVEKVSPHYSAAKYSELERDRLYARSGANPRRRR
jgi:hypothetical protein